MLPFIITFLAGCSTMIGYLFVYLKDNNSTEFTIEIKVVENRLQKIEKESPTETLGNEKNIVLTKDIILNNGKSIQNKNAGVSIYGNGYYISFYGGPLYKNINSNDTDKFQDLILLGESNGNLLPSVATLKLENVKLYGVAKGSISGSSTNETTLTSYACIANSYDDITVSGENVSVENYGTIVSADGKDATATLSATKGKLITFGSTSTNYGVVKTGNGGNGWAKSQSLSWVSVYRTYNGDVLARQAILGTRKAKVSELSITSSIQKSEKQDAKDFGTCEDIDNSINGTNGLSYGAKEMIFNCGALVLGYRYDYGDDYTYGDPLYAVIKPGCTKIDFRVRFEKSETLFGWGGRDNTKSLYYINGEKQRIDNDNYDYIAATYPSLFHKKNKDKQVHDNYKYDIEDYVFNALVSQGTANFGKSFSTTY